MIITLLPLDINWTKAEDCYSIIEGYFVRTPKSDIILLPEAFTTGFGKDMLSNVESQSGETLSWMKNIANQLDCMLVGTWIVEDNGKRYNRMHCVMPEGKVVTYDKAHLFRFSIEGEAFAKGVTKEVFEWRGWRIKPAICYDIRFPMWLHNSGNDEHLDYDLMLVSASWPAVRSKVWNTLLQARAIENVCYVAGCNRVGTDSTGAEYKKDSMIVDYKGNIVADTNTANSDGTISYEVSLDDLMHFRRRWPFYLDYDK